MIDSFFAKELERNDLFLSQSWGNTLLSRVPTGVQNAAQKTLQESNPSN